jgi:hypothetical protein
MSIWNKSLKKSLLLFMGLFFFAANTQASHIVGGEVWYQWISGNTYQVGLNLYRDCGGLTPPATVNVSYDGCGVSGSILLSQTGAPVTVTAICQSSIANSSCNGGSLYSIQRITYSGTVTLPFACSFWVFSYDECCRTNLSNISSPNSTDMYYKAILNNVAAPQNNSARFNTVPTTIIPVNATSNLDWSAYDADGDSLVYMFTSALRGPGQQVVYLPSYSASQPFSAALPTGIDSTNGIITVTPNIVQNPTVSIKVNEYRNGTLIGTVYRDLMVSVYPNNNNLLPTMSGINGSGIYTVSVCAGDTLSFSLTASDPNPSQSPSISLANTNTTAVFNMIPASSTGVFSWAPDSTLADANPYHFNFSVVDNFCDFMGVQSYSVEVSVNVCNANDVWPGDANYDGVANAYDILAIGQSFSSTGPVRTNASLQWNAQPASDWSASVYNGTNQKHSDTDGNGVVAFDDTLAISLNYGQSHPLRMANGLMLPSADLQVTASVDTIGTSMPVELIVAISTPIDSIAGLAFRLLLDPTLVKINQTTIDYVGSVMGTNNVDMIKVDKVIFNSGMVEVGLSRTDHQNISGTGQIVRIGIVTTDNVSGKVTMYLDPMDIDGITASGSPVTLSPVGTEVVIDPAYTSIPNWQDDFKMVIAPVPSTGIVNVVFGGIVNELSYTLVSTLGELVFSGSFTQKQNLLDISYLPKGIYQLNIQTEKGIMVRKIIKI